MSPAFELLRSSGQRLVCSPDSNSELFAATIGGLGLTGLILWAETRLQRVAGAGIAQERIRFGSLDEFLTLAAEDAAHEYTVAWVDPQVDSTTQSPSSSQAVPGETTEPNRLITPSAGGLRGLADALEDRPGGAGRPLPPSMRSSTVAA
jgi:hypothetical protein